MIASTRAVRIVEHYAGWPAQAREELGRVKEALGPVAVRLEHVGSTAVLGLAAKPILDLQLSDNVKAWDMRADGSYVQRRPGEGEEPRSSQDLLMQRALERAGR